MPLGVCQDLAIAGMIGSFHRNDTLTGFWVLLTQILGKLCLRAGRANDQDFAGIADGVHHLRKKFLVEPGVTAAYRFGFVVKVSRGQLRMQSNFVFARQADVEDLGLRMVDPDDRMEGRHVFSLRKQQSASLAFIFNLTGAHSIFRSATYLKKNYRNGASAD
jgi:hypothetical protein